MKITKRRRELIKQHLKNMEKDYVGSILIDDYYDDMTEEVKKIVKHALNIRIRKDMLNRVFNGNEEEYGRHGENILNDKEFEQILGDIYNRYIDLNMRIWYDENAIWRVDFDEEKEPLLN